MLPYVLKFKFVRSRFSNIRNALIFLDMFMDEFKIVMARITVCIANKSYCYGIRSCILNLST
jgi:hypothetical protein